MIKGNQKDKDEPHLWTVLSHGVDAMIEAGVAFSAYPQYVLDDVLEDGGRQRITNLALSRDNPGGLRVEDMIVLIEQVVQEHDRPEDQRPVTREEKRRRRERFFPVLDGIEDFPEPRAEQEDSPASDVDPAPESSDDDADVKAPEPPQRDPEAIDPPKPISRAYLSANLLRIENLLSQWRSQRMSTEEVWDAACKAFGGTPRPIEEDD